jgi:preprotein translocase subunit YajC
MPWPLLLAPILLAQAAPAAEKGAAPAPAAATAPAAGTATTKTVTAAPAPAPASGAESSLPTIIVLGPIFLLFYLLLVRPQQQAEKKRKSLVESLKKNDRVFTSAGIYGTVVSVESDQDKVVLRVDDDKGVRMTFSKASILRVVDAKPEKSAEVAT